MRNVNFDNLMDASDYATAFPEESFNDNFGEEFQKKVRPLLEALEEEVSTHCTPKQVIPAMILAVTLYALGGPSTLAEGVQSIAEMFLHSEQGDDRPSITLDDGDDPEKNV